MDFPRHSDRTPSRAEVSAFLAGIRDYQSAYHGHKETLGWLGVAAYIVAVVAVATSSLHGWAVALAIVAGTVAAIGYVRRQFNLRMAAVQVVRATSVLAARAMTEDLQGLAPAPEEFAEQAAAAHARKAGPVRRFVYPDRHDIYINRDMLPAVVVDELARDRDPRNRGRAQALERFAYALLCVVGISAIIAVLTGGPATAASEQSTQTVDCVARAAQIAHLVRSDPRLTAALERRPDPLDGPCGSVASIARLSRR
jgi:hypothetical protein